jgi:hypothetical protein
MAAILVGEVREARARGEGPDSDPAALSSGSRQEEEQTCRAPPSLSQCSWLHLWDVPAV